MIKNDEKKEHIEEGEQIAEAVVDGTEQLQQHISDLDQKAKRYLADYQNLQRRVQEERISWIRNANKDLLLKFLPVLDTLMLAGKHSDDKGLTISIAQFEDVLKEADVTRIKTTGEVFDPATMECVTTKEGKEDVVMEELRPGYMLGDTVLRSAQVIVGV